MHLLFPFQVYFMWVLDGDRKHNVQEWCHCSRYGMQFKSYHCSFVNHSLACSCNSIRCVTMTGDYVRDMCTSSYSMCTNGVESSIFFLSGIETFILAQYVAPFKCFNNQIVSSPFCPNQSMILTIDSLPSQKRHALLKAKSVFYQIHKQFITNVLHFMSNVQIRLSPPYSSPMVFFKE